MKKISCAFILAAMLAGCDSGVFSSADQLRQQSQQSLEKKNYADAAKYAEDYIKKAPDSYEAYFLLAQARAQTGDKNAALAALEMAIKKGFKDDAAISANPNLQVLHPLAAYVELMDSAFPKREKEIAGSGDVGIKETDSKTVIRAGDVVIEMPKEK